MALLRFLVAVVGMHGLAACAADRAYQWTEDVALSGGQKIVVDRRAVFEATNDLLGARGAGWLFKESSIAAQLPAPIEKRISLEGRLAPLVLDISDGVAYLIGVPTAIGEDLWKVPRHELYVAFRLGSEGWQRIPLRDIPEGLHPNLLASVRTLFVDRDSAPRHVTLDLKSRLDSRPELDRRYKTIIRLPAPKN